MKNWKTKFDEFNVRLSRTLNGKYAALITFITIIALLIAMGIALNLALKNVKSMEQINKLELVNFDLTKKMKLADFEYSAALSTASKEIDSLEKQLDSIKIVTKIVYVNILERDGVIVKVNNEFGGKKYHKVLDFKRLENYMNRNVILPGIRGSSDSNLKTTGGIGCVFSNIKIRYLYNNLIGTYNLDNTSTKYEHR